MRNLRGEKGKGGGREEARQIDPAFMVMVHCPWSPTQRERERELNDTARRRRSRLAIIVTLLPLEESLLAPSQADFESLIRSPILIRSWRTGDGDASVGSGVMRAAGQRPTCVSAIFWRIFRTRGTQECDEAPPPPHNIFA